MKHYLMKNRKMLLILLIVFLSFNFYFLLLLSELELFYLLYIDSLLVLCVGLFLIMDYLIDSKKQKQRQQRINTHHLIYQEFEQLEDYDIISHDIHILEEQLDDQMNINCDLQDYISKWCHEIKIPLSTLFLMIEKIEDETLKKAMKEQVERMKQQLHTALVGCRIQSKIFDFQVKKVRLEECVKTSIKNNQFFLIHHHFELRIQMDDVCVYSDLEWLIYVLDQIVANAMKYNSGSPTLTMWTKRDEKKTSLYIEDNGVGIKECDIKYVFDKGFTGSNHHNGKYKATGMGLYIVQSILDKLGHKIYIESEYGKFTRIKIEFEDTGDFLFL